MTSSLHRVLAQQQQRGLLGSGPITTHIVHGRALAAVVDGVPDRALDLGSGGGVPGLVLATECWPEAEVVLLDANQRRCTYLELAVGELGLADRVTVRWGRAEEIGHDPAMRARHDVVVARSFGPPAVVAECGAALLGPGGQLVVSDPPGGPGERWDDAGLALLGLERELSQEVEGSWFTRVRQTGAYPDDLPRRSGVPGKRPLF